MNKYMHSYQKYAIKTLFVVLILLVFLSGCLFGGDREITDEGEINSIINAFENMYLEQDPYVVQDYLADEIKAYNGVENTYKKQDYLDSLQLSFIFIEKFYDASANNRKIEVLNGKAHAEFEMYLHFTGLGMEIEEIESGKIKLEYTNGQWLIYEIQEVF